MNQREKAYEAKYLHDEELNFKINARRNRLFGEWAASLLNYTGEKADTYCDDVIMAAFQKNHNMNAFGKVLKDLEQAKVDISEHRVQKEFERCWEEAKEMIMKDKEE